MPGRCCSSTRRRAHRGSLPSPCGSVPDEAGRSRRPCAPGLPEPTAGPPHGGRPHIPAALPRTGARRSPRHASRPGVAAGLSRVAPHAPGGPPCHAPPVAFLGLRRARTIHIDRVPGLCPDSCYPRGAGPRSPRSLGDHPIFFRLSSLVPTRRRPTTPDGPDAPLPERHVIGLVHRRRTVSPARHGPRRPFLTGLACCPQGCPLRCHILWISAPSDHATPQPRS